MKQHIIPHPAPIEQPPFKTEQSVFACVCVTMDDINLALKSCNGLLLRQKFTGNLWEMTNPVEKRSQTLGLLRCFSSLVSAEQMALIQSADAVQALESALSYYSSSSNAVSAASEGYRGAVDNVVRKVMFQHLTQLGDFLAAARIYSTMRMGPSGDDEVVEGDFTAAEKCDIFVSIAECFLAEDEAVEADAAVQKAGLFVDKIENMDAAWQIILRYKSNYVTILDSNRKFLQAASRYYEVSQTNRKEIDPGNLLELLGSAATCAILAKSGPQRHRILALICKDERLEQLDQLPNFQHHSIILTKMYKNQLLQKKELESFEKSLQEHQKATMSNGMTIMEHAVIEHNMVAASKLYASILFSELAVLLGVSSAFIAEKIAASMIVDGQLKGTIDQVDGILTFEEAEDECGLVGWDRSIADVCDEFNKLSDIMKAGALTV